MHYALAEWHLHRTPMKKSFDEWWSKKLAELDETKLTLIDKQQLDTLRSLAYSMIKRYEYFSNKIDTSWNPVFAEKNITIPVENTGASLSGTIDLLIRKDDGLWIVDHKTYALFTDAAELEVNWQLMCYCWLVYKYTGEYPRGAILNQLRKKAVEEPELLATGRLSLAKRAPVTYESFLSAIHKHGFSEKQYIGILSYLKTTTDYWNKREAITFDTNFYETFHRTLEPILKNMVEDTAVYPTYSSRCKWCSFRIPCLADLTGGYTDSILEENYRVSEGRVL